MNNDRYAGILLHITSLPGPAYIGDIGPAAKLFAEFLHGSGQSYWQLLPVQPVSADQGFSPYSSSSAVAGNPLLISPELLVADGLLSAADITNSGESNKTDYNKAKKYKEKLLDKAYKNWLKKNEQSEFNDYCAKEEYWINDFALYTVIKSFYNNSPWYEWPDLFKDRDENKLKEFSIANDYEISKVKWIQMVFDKQWKQLKSYCDSLHIQLLGDVPFYVGYDSADVWSHKEIFAIDENGKTTDVAGVPPDLFNDEGQLWGMPLFKWDVLKSRNYDWWVNRFKKNLEYFNILRLDHFRAFSSYWSVPANAKSAKNGSWVKGPGKDVFDAIRSAIGDLPFVAEDLGEIDEPVYQLRDDLNLPGMNVLQFAFGDDMPQSQYLPHNHIQNSIVYTGTHDNNTTLGWFKELKKSNRKNISEYIGLKINSKNICDQMCRLAYMSISKLAIIPVQDVLGLDESARMNMPASASNNWLWRLKTNEINKSVEKKLHNWSFYYGRTRD